MQYSYRIILIKEKFFSFSPPDIPQHLKSPDEFHRIHQIDPTIKIISSNPAINDDHNCSFEDEENDDEHSQPVDHPDSQTNGGGMIIKAYALYDFNGKQISFFILRCSNRYSSLGHGNNGSQYVNAVTISVGEYVDILEDDQGDGWTRIQKADGSTGFVPSSYLRIDSQKLPISSQKIDSGRF
jgi:hypothetical protein